MREKDYEREIERQIESERKNEIDCRVVESFLTLFSHFWQDNNKAGTRPIVAKQPLNVCVFVRVCVLVCFCS